MLKDYKGHSPRIDPSARVLDNTVIIGNVTLEKDSSIWPGCVLRADVEAIVIGEGSNLQDGVLAHPNYGLPVVLGRGVTVGHGAIVHGCRVGDNCLIGMGAILLDGVVVEENCIIGAGALVTEKTHVPAGHLALGVPAKVVRALTAEEIEKIKWNAREYVELSEAHLSTDRPAR